jgi:hypothetical protein
VRNCGLNAQHGMLGFMDTLADELNPTSVRLLLPIDRTRFDFGRHFKLGIAVGAPSIGGECDSQTIKRDRR